MIKKNILYLILAIITVIQIYIYMIYMKEDKVSIETISNKQVEIKKSFRDIDKELNNIENLELLELKDEGESWIGKILLSGDRKAIVNSIELLKNYNISNYKIDGNANNFQVLLDICR